MALSKRGQVVLDTTTILLMLFIGGVIFVFVTALLSDVNDDIQADADFTAEAKASMQTVNDHYASTWDGLFGFAVVLLWVFLLVTSFFVDAHPVFFMVTVLLMLCLLLIVPVVANTYEEITTADGVAVFAADFPIMNWVFEHLFAVFIVISGSTMVVLYAKNGGGP